MSDMNHRISRWLKDADSTQSRHLTGEELSQIVEQFHIGDVQQFIHDVEVIYQSYIFNKQILEMFPREDMTKKNLKARINEAEKFRLNLVETIGDPELHPYLLIRLRQNLNAYIDGLEMALDSVKKKKKSYSSEYHVFRRLGFLYKSYTGNQPFSDLKQNKNGGCGTFDEFGDFIDFDYCGPFMDFMLVTTKPLGIDMADKSQTIYNAARSLI